MRARVIYGTVILFAAIIVLAGRPAGQRLMRPSQAAERRPRGEARLVAIEPFANMDGDMCPWVPVSAGQAETSLFQQVSLA